MLSTLFSVMMLQTQSVSDAIDEAITDAIDYLPVVVGALVILIVGYVIGRFLGGLVTRVVRRLGVDRYASGTALEGSGEGDAIARALGKLVSYYVYFVAVLAAANVLDIPELSELLADLGSYLPVILGAVLVLVIGFVVGRILGNIVGDLVGSLGIGPYLRETPLEQFGDRRGEFGRLVGSLVTYYVYLLTLLAVADIVQITALSTLLNTFAGYLPVLAGGLIVLLVGIWVAERVGRIVSESDEGRATNLAGVAVKVFIYYLTITIVLDTVGVATGLLTNTFTAFVVAFFGALALALAIGIGIAVGLGGQDYVAENIDDWADSARGMAESEGSGGGSGGGGDGGVTDGGASEGEDSGA